MRYILLLTVLLTYVHGEDFCPFDSTSVSSPCTASACNSLPATTSHDATVQQTCTQAISTYCKHVDRTQSADPGCYDYNNVTTTETDTNSAPSPVNPAPAPENNNDTPATTSNPAPSPTTQTSPTTVPSPTTDTTTTVPSPTTTVPSPVAPTEEHTPAPVPTTKPEEPVFAPAPVATTQSSIKAQVSLTIPSTANITTEELQSVTVKAGLETQLAAAIGIDVQYVTITAIYLCPGDTRCDTTNRRELQQHHRLKRELNAEAIRIVVEFVVAATEEIIKLAESGMSDTATFTETLSTGASTSLTKTLNKEITVKASSPTTLERTTATDPDANADQTNNNNESEMPSWFLPVVVTAGGLTIAMLVGFVLLNKRAKDKKRKAIQPYLDDDVLVKDEPQRKKKKNSRGREAGTNFASPSSNNTGKKKSSPYAVPEPGNKRLQQSQRSEGKSPRSPYAVVEKGNENENENTRSKFSPVPGSGSKSTMDDNAVASPKTPTSRRPLPPLRSKSNLSPIATRGAVIGPGSPVALPSPSAVNRYRAFQAEKKKKMEIRQKKKEEKALKLEAAGGDGNGSPKRSRSLSPSRMSEEDKSEMLSQYKLAHKKMYASVKERLKTQHLERLKKLAKLKKEEARLRSPAAIVALPTSPTSPASLAPVGTALTSDPTSTGESKTSTTTVAVDAASNVVSDESKKIIMDAANEPNKNTPSRKEVLDGYKAEHRRMRAQMKAKLKTEYMARLKAERAKKNKAKANKGMIDGEGGSK